MVANPRATLRSGAFKPLNTPDPVSVEENSAGLPVAVKTKRRLAVSAIENTWRIDDEWWRSEPVSRIYYTVLLAPGQRLVLFKDLRSNGWYQQAC
jgi:hypothetical protein